MSRLMPFASVLCIVLVFAGINRGFDISDEGLYVLLADPNQENVAGIFNYDLFFKLVYSWFGYSFSLVELRVLRLVGYLAGAFALAGFWKNITEEKQFNLEVFWLCCLGIFFGYGFLPATLSYNSLTVVLVCFWLYFISKTRLTWRSMWPLGIILAALVYIKVSIALIFFPLTFLFLIFRGSLSLGFCIGLILPFFASEVLFLLMFDESALTRLMEGIPLTTQRDTYQLKLMIRSMAVGGLWMTLVGLLFAGLGYLRNKESSIYPAMQLFLAFGVLWICYVTHITDEWNHLILLASAAFLGFHWGTGAFNPKQTNLWILFLLVLPFVLHFGSNVYWLRIGIHYLVFWILAAKWILKKLTWEINLATIMLAILLVFNGIWWHPFGHHKPLWSEKIAWEVGERQSIYLDPELVAIASKLGSFTWGNSDSQIPTAYRIPGLAWLAGSTSPRSPGIWEKSQLDAFFKEKPKSLIYNKFEDLPTNWDFSHQEELGVFRSDSLQLLWD